MRQHTNIVLIVILTVVAVVCIGGAVYALRRKRDYEDYVNFTRINWRSKRNYSTLRMTLARLN